MSKGDRYSNMDSKTAFGFSANAFDKNKEGDGDTATSFPRSDAEDLSRGARYIPGEITLARRAGQKVHFVVQCNSPCCWYWQMPDGSRIYHFERSDYERICDNHNSVCPECGNTNISGGIVKKE